MITIEQNAELTKNLVYFLSADGEVDTLMALRGVRNTLSSHATLSDRVEAYFVVREELRQEVI